MSTSSTPSTLPSSRAFITTLLSELSEPTPHPQNPNSANAASGPYSGSGQRRGSGTDAVPPPSFNPLNAVPENKRKLFLTLHVLFPNEVLPALDLLERRLVGRLRVGGRGEEGEGEEEGNGEGEEEMVHKARNEGTAEGANGTGDAMDVDVQEQDTGPQPPLSSVQNLDSNTEQPPITTPLSNPNHPPRASKRKPKSPPPQTIYYVRSAQQRSSRHATSYDSTTYYEVRLGAWNCSCPAFAFAAFPATDSASREPEPEPEPESESEAGPGSAPASLDLNAQTSHQHQHPQHHRNPSPQPPPPNPHSADDEDPFLFGGSSLSLSPSSGIPPPVCKHLLACVLGERVAMFAPFVEERGAGVEEAAGWAAGWGD